MANCSICGEKMGIFDRESCSDGFVCKRCRSLFSDLGMDYKTVPADKLKEGWEDGKKAKTESKLNCSAHKYHNSLMGKKKTIASNL